MPRVVVAMAELSSAIQLAMITCARQPGARSAKYSLTKPVPIFCRNGHGEGPFHRPPLLRHRPAFGIWAKIGAPAGHPARIQDERPVNGGEPRQLASRLDLATPHAASQGLSAQAPS